LLRLVRGGSVSAGSLRPGRGLPSFAATKVELDASANEALQHLYTLGSLNKELAGKAAGILNISCWRPVSRASGELE